MLRSNEVVPYVASFLAYQLPIIVEMPINPSNTLLRLKCARGDKISSHIAEPIKPIISVEITVENLDLGVVFFHDIILSK